MTVIIAERPVCQPDTREKRGITPTPQIAGAKAPQELPPGFGVRRCSGAFQPARRALVWIALLALIALAAPTVTVEAATRTWSGGAPLLNTWSIAANWSAGVAPVAGDNLIFPLGAARMTNRNDFPAGTAFGSITFQRGGYLVTGNALSPASVNASHIAGTTTFLPDLELANALTLDASGLNPTLVVSNLIAGSFDVMISGSGHVTMVGELDADGSSDFRKTGSGQLTLDPDRTVFMDATVTIDDGSVWVLAVLTTDFVVNSGGTLRGDDYVDSVTSNGGIIAPGTDETDSIFVFDSIVFDAATRVQLRLNGRFDYDYLGLSLTTPTSLTLGSSQLELEVSPSVEVGEIYAIVDANNAGSVITGRFAGHSEGSRFTEDGFTFEITYQGGEHGNSVVLTVVDVPPTGVTRTWDGGGTNASWSTPANWVGNVAPIQGDDLVFPAGTARATNVNNFSSGWTFNSITFTGSNYITSGSSVIALRAGMTNSPVSGMNHFVCPLLLLRNQGIRCLDPDAELEVAGNIDGDGNTLTFAGTGRITFSGNFTDSGSIVKNNSGRLTLAGNNTATNGTLTLNDGTVWINGAYTNLVALNLNGATLGGVGAVSALTSVGGLIRPGNAGPGILELGDEADASFDGATVFEVQLQGTVPGTEHDQLRQTGRGVINLGGSTLQVTFPTPPLVGDSFTILQAFGSGPRVNGAFNGLPEGSDLVVSGLHLRITYRGGDGNDVVLSRLAPPLPPCPEPVLSIRQLTNSVELRWPSCPSNFYQVAWTTNFQQWQMLTPPLAAPDVNDVMTWTTPTALPYQFFQLVVRPLTNSSVPASPGIYPGRIFTHGGIARTYRLVVPQSITNAMPAPLMLALHGHNQTADSFANNIPNLSTYANETGVILVFPNGTDDANGTGWNILPPTPENPVDDVAFLLALIDELDETLNIDRKRVYAGGFSNGGQMCHRLAATTTNVFAAFAAVGSAVAGTFGTETLIYQQPPLEPNSMLIVNATNDCKRPYWGGLNVDGVLQPPARDSMTHWTNANFCTPSPVITTNVFVTNHINRVFADCGGPYPPFNSPRTNLVIREHYQLTCTPGTEVLFVTLTDGGHAWVEAADHVGFDTSREVLSFFLRHCRCDAIGATEPLVIPTAPGQYELSLCDQSYSRLFRLQIPAGYNPAVAAPLAFVFHGGQQTVAEFSAQHPGLYAKANLENMLLVLPQATVHPATRDTLWGDRPFDTVVDDVSFVTNLLEHLNAELNVDGLRIYAAGFSSGGEFSHWMASTTTGLLAAIAPVCAQTGWNEPDASGPIVMPPPPLEPIPVLMVRGGVDPKRPFNGGANVDGVLCRSAAEDVAYWVSGNTCVGAPVITAGAGVMRWDYSACAGTTEVILVRVDALGHAWPDAAPFNANVQVIDFLLTHTR